MEKINQSLTLDFEHFKGKIQWDSDLEEMYLGNDSGKNIYFKDLERIITEHEGFKIEIKFID